MGGAAVHSKSFLPGSFSMRDFNEESSSSSWPRLNRDTNVTNGQYVDGFVRRMMVNGHEELAKDSLKQKIIEHDHVFRNQVHELHRVYRLQRDIMEESGRKELHQRASREPSSLSTGCWKRNESRLSRFMYENGFTWKDSVESDLRPSKVRKRLFDLQLPAEEYVDSEGESAMDYKEPDLPSYSPGRNRGFTPQNRMKLIDGRTGISVSETCFKASVDLADLNEPVQIEDSMAYPSVCCKEDLHRHEPFSMALTNGNYDLSRNSRVEPVVASSGKSKPVLDIDLNEAMTDLEASSIQIWRKHEAVSDLNEPFMLSSSEIVRNKEISEISKKKMITIDINVVYEPEEEINDEELVGKKRESSAFFIDLNSSASDCEDLPAPLEIDLEAPQREEPIYSEVLRIAANTILSLSSCSIQADVKDYTCHPSETSLADSLLWFVDMVASFVVELDQKSDGRNDSDEFESMTLQLIETKEEDYMPRQREEDVTVRKHVRRGRRGLSKRGRQRRDFQREILPGLASLSRIEITEDLQTFGGVMRASGHYWNSGQMRRNTGRRRGSRGKGRGVVETTNAVIRTVVSAPLTEAGFEDRSLAGWGKTTRRPHRQRCPAGNPPAVPLT